MRVLLTGAAGQLGNRVLDQLVDGHEIVAFDQADRPQSMPANVRYIQGDLLNADKVREAAAGCDAVVHLGAIAGPFPLVPQSTIFQINTQGTYHVLEAAQRANARIVILASSLCAIGFPTSLSDHGLSYLPVDENHPCRPRHAYDLSKHVNETTAETFSRLTGISTICLRLPALFDVRASRWFPAEVYTDPPRLVLADYMDLADAARLIDIALQRSDLRHEVIFAAAETSGTHIPTPEYIKRFNPPLEWRGEPPGDTTPLINTARMKSILGFTPTITWQQGMKDLPQSNNRY